MRESLALKIPFSDLSGHVLDEIIDNLLNNPETFQWQGPDGLAYCLDVDQKTLKSKLQTWNSQKIRFANISPDTSDKDLKLATVMTKEGVHVDGSTTW